MQNKTRTVLLAPLMEDLAESHRMASLGRAFCALGHRVIVFGDGRFEHLLDDPRFRRIHSACDRRWMTRERFRMMHDLDRYAMGWISAGDLSAFVAEETAVLAEARPDVVVTGFRPSLSLATRVAGVPLVWVLSAAVSDRYFERGLGTMPHGVLQRWPLLQCLPARMRDRMLNRAVRKMRFRRHAWNTVGRRLGVGGFGNAVHIFRGDFNLMSDAAEVFPEFGELPPYYAFSGPLLMADSVPMPASVQAFRRRPGRPLVYSAMGSSGDPAIFRRLVEAFQGQPYDVFASGVVLAAGAEPLRLPENVVVETFFPGQAMAGMADAAVIHGGQGTVYATMCAGTPFVGIPMFMEQQFNLEAFARQGCGVVLARHRLGPDAFLEALRRVTTDAAFREHAQRMRALLAKYRTDEALNPSRVGAEHILRFLEHPEDSYFRLGPQRVRRHGAPPPRGGGEGTAAGGGVP